MNIHSTTTAHETIVIGAGQAGLSTGYHLAKRGRDFVMLEGHQRVGDIWRKRFDSLKLYSPAKYDGLPGMAFPAARWCYPDKDQVADYFEAYADKFALPIETGVSVRRLAADDGGFRVETGDRAYRASNVVVATGTWQKPLTPQFAADLDPSIYQVHSHDYRNTSQLRPGATLVVGAAHSGADIALEVANAGHDTVLSGPYRGEIPFDIESRRARVVLPVLWFAANHVLTERTPVGRKVQPHVRGGGGPLLRVKSAHLDAAGVEHVDDKVVGVEGGKPVLADGRVLDVANIVWCTGFGKDLSWIDFLVPGEDGWPEQTRGAVKGWPGLYFVGLPFLYSFSSMLVGGAGRDAEHVAKQIDRNPAGRAAAAGTAATTADSAAGNASDQTPAPA
jgi:putative flavoprotein involved in K+ transport